MAGEGAGRERGRREGKGERELAKGWGRGERGRRIGIAHSLFSA